MIKFKTQAYQSAAVQAVVDCFEGQPAAQAQGAADDTANAPLQLSDAALLQNIRHVQSRQNLPASNLLVKAPVGGAALDVEMETGTGKTYCYIKTLFELNARYGWSKFIVVVPSIAIREGVASSLQSMRGHFLELYGKRARFFVYSSRQLHQIESFASDAGIQVMVINAQAFAARGAENRRIYEEQDDFQSRRPMDVLRATRPILILDEPQKMEGAATLSALEQFHALMVLRYSATHKTLRHLVHRLDALDAYQQKLVKRISVRGISVRGLGAGQAYLYLQAIELSPDRAPQARVEFEQTLGSGASRRVVRKLTQGDNLHALSNALEAYRGYGVEEIDALNGTLTFANGTQLAVGDAVGDASEGALRRLQIREAIAAHLDKERSLFGQGIKVLSLFFVDEVAKYRDYAAPDQKGDYARMFEEAYQEALAERLGPEDTPYTRYLRAQQASAVHSGYFSIDRKTRRWTDPAVEKRGENAGQSNDADAYELILKDKERLLSFAEPVRFVFSHSALREGWDNPNVFVICALKRSDHTVSRRQEVGRGLRLSVNQAGERMDDPASVHEVNVLTVVAAESYQAFVSALQKDLRSTLSPRPPLADSADFASTLVHDARRVSLYPMASQCDAPQFLSLWRAIHRQARYRVHFDHEAWVLRAAAALDRQLRVSAPQATVQIGEQAQDAFVLSTAATAETTLHAEPSMQPCDLIGRIAERTQLTRRTSADILQRIGPAVFAQFSIDPERFIAEAARLITTQRTLVAVEHVAYELLAAECSPETVPDGQAPLDSANADELAFLHALATNADVAAYAKLPSDFVIPTPAGSVHPGWIVCFHQGPGQRRNFLVKIGSGGSVRPAHSRDALQLQCINRFVQAVNERSDAERIEFAAVQDFAELVRHAKRAQH